MTEFNITQTKVSLPYKKDKWSPLKPESRIVYDKDFLLFLREHENNDQKYLSENLIGNWNCIKIQKLEQSKVKRNKIAKSNLKLRLSYKKDQWSPLNPNGRKVYDKMFLSSLREHPQSKQRPQYLTEDFIGKWGFMKIHKVQKVKIIKKESDKENELISKVLESDSFETNFHSCNINNREGTDLPISLQPHSHSRQKPEDIINRWDNDILPKAKYEIGKVHGDNIVLCLSDEKVGIQTVNQLKFDHLLEDLMVLTEGDDIVKSEWQYKGDGTDASVLDNDKLTKDQWSPINPSGRKAYDKDFLLWLREHPKSKQRPEYLSEDLFVNWGCMNIDKLQQRNRTAKNKNLLIELKNEVVNSNIVATNLSSSYNKDQMSVLEPEVKKVYDKDFLLSLNQHTYNNQKPDSLYEGIDRTMSFNKLPKIDESSYPKSKQQHPDHLLENLMIFIENNGQQCIEDKSNKNNESTLDYNKLIEVNNEIDLQVNPSGRNTYDKDLLSLRKHPNSKQNPPYLSEVGNCSSAKIYKVQQVQIQTNSTVDLKNEVMDATTVATNFSSLYNKDQMSAVFKLEGIDENLHEGCTMTIVSTEDNEKDQQALLKSNEREVSFDLHPKSKKKCDTWPEDLIDLMENYDNAEKETDADNHELVDFKICASYIKDHWYHLIPSARIVYDKDFLLSLRECTNSQKRPQYLPKDIIRNSSRIKTDEIKSNSFETSLPSSHKKDVIGYDHIMTIHEWERVNDKRGNTDVKLELASKVTESNSLFSSFNDTNQQSSFNTYEGKISVADATLSGYPQSKQNPDALQKDLIDLFDDNKLMEVKNENTVDESNPAENKLSVTYKRGQWSPLNPYGRKVYDREFLLSLRWRVTD